MTKQKRLLLQQALFLCLLISFYIWISLPGLSGGFILDDWPNLEHLSQIKSYQDIWAFTFSGITGNPGRPFSYFSFALQAEHWAQNPYPFKLVNLSIHIMNALIVYHCCLLLSRLLDWPLRSRLVFAGIVFCLWLFLPLHISTVFYVIQRMTLLAGFFTLLGVNSFLRGFILSEKQPTKGLVLATTGICIAYIAGILCKENAVLVGLYITIVYCFLLRENHHSRLWDFWVLLCGVLPPLIVFLYLFISERYLSGYSLRDFTLVERLLTESIIVWEYTDKILFPSPSKLNIFNDGFPIAKSLTESPASLFAVFGWLMAITLSLILRKKAAFLSFAILWFLSGHLLESTFMGLELYFEHRNYIPSLGLLMGITGFIITHWQKLALNDALTRKIKITSLALPATMCCWFVIVSGVEVKSWSSPGTLAVSALTERPNSLRARQEAAAFFANSKDFPRAAFLLATIEQKWPGYPGNYAQMLMLNCLDHHVKTAGINSIKDRFRQGRFDRGTSDAMHQILLFKKQGYCNNLTWDDYRGLVNAILSNTKFSRNQENFITMLAISYNAQNNFQMAAESLDLLPEVKGDFNFLLLKAQFHVMAGHYKNALLILDRIHHRYKDNFKVWPAKQLRVEQLKNKIKDKLSQTY